MTFGWHSIQWYMALRPWVPLLKHLNIILKSKLESRVLKRKLISSINYPSHGFARSQPLPAPVAIDLWNLAFESFSGQIQEFCERRRHETGVSPPPPPPPMEIRVANKRVPVIWDQNPRS